MWMYSLPIDFQCLRSFSHRILTSFSVIHTSYSKRRLCGMSGKLYRFYFFSGEFDRLIFLLSPTAMRQVWRETKSERKTNSKRPEFVYLKDKQKHGTPSNTLEMWAHEIWKRNQKSDEWRSKIEEKYHFFSSNDYFIWNERVTYWMWHKRRFWLLFSS